MDPLAELAARFSSLELRVGVAGARAGVAEAKVETLEKRVVELQSENGRLRNENAELRAKGPVRKQRSAPTATLGRGRKERRGRMPVGM